MQALWKPWVVQEKQEFLNSLIPQNGLSHAFHKGQKTEVLMGWKFEDWRLFPKGGTSVGLEYSLWVNRWCGMCCLSSEPPTCLTFRRSLQAPFSFSVLSLLQFQPQSFLKNHAVNQPRPHKTSMPWLCCHDLCYCATGNDDGQYFTVPHPFLQESTGIHRNGTGKVWHSSYSPSGIW